jgi:ADP-ribose pyrophosphatase
MVIERVDLDEAVRMALAGEITNATAVVGVLAAARARDRDWADLRDPAAVPEQHYAPPDPVPAGR